MFPFQGFLRHFKVASGLMQKELEEQGFSIIDRALGGSWAARAKEEIRALHKASRLHLNATHHVLTNNKVETLPKNGIWELSSKALLRDEFSKLRWGMSSNLSTTLTPTLDSFIVESTALHSAFERVGLEHPSVVSSRIEATTVKLQFNAGKGGSFPLHFDTAPGVDSRFLTAIYYLNEMWQPGDGGELQLCPFPYEPLQIEPISDRLVVFSSMNMLHRVLSSTKKRYCVTFWMYLKDSDASSGPASGRPVKPSTSSNIGVAESVALSILLSPQLRRHFARIALDEKWRASLEASHIDSPARTMAIERHRNESSAIERTLGKYLADMGLDGRAKDPKALAQAHYPICKEVHPNLVHWF